MTGVRSFRPAGALNGSLRPPPDKSISHRAALLAGMANGRSELRGYLDSADTRSTLEAVRTLGCAVDVADADVPGALDVRIDGVGLRGPGARAGADAVSIDVGNAGTLMRLLPGWLAGQGQGSWTLAGDESIARRPVDRIVDPLRLMGASLDCRDGRLPPLGITGADLQGVTYEMPIASAQVKSCLLLAGLLAEGAMEVIEATPSRDHTERMLAAAGVGVSVEKVGSGLSLSGSLPGRRVRVKTAEAIEPCGFDIPGDFSSAAFFVVGALIVPGSRVMIEGVGLNPTRVGLLGILNRMGAAIEVREEPARGGEARGALDVRRAPLHGTTIAAGEVPLAIDELPLVGLLGCFAEGRTVVRGAEELRHKESDRIARVVELLRAIGGEVEALEDGFAVMGTGGIRGGSVDSHGDHRLAMVGAIAGLASREGVEVHGMEAVAVSYPGFEADLSRLTA